MISPILLVGVGEGSGTFAGICTLKTFIYYQPRRTMAAVANDLTSVWFRANSPLAKLKKIAE